MKILTVIIVIGLLASFVKCSYDIQERNDLEKEVQELTKIKLKKEIKILELQDSLYKLNP